MADGRPESAGVVPSAPSELAWLLTLLVSARPYAKPAVVELDQSLLPGVSEHQAPFRERFAALWQDELEDELDGVPEVVYLAGATGTLLSEDPKPFLAAVARLGGADPIKLRLLGESEADGAAIQRRIDRLRDDAGLRETYLAFLGEVWSLAAETWRKEGLKRVRTACREWERRLATATPVEELLSPRHPLVRSPDRVRIQAALPSFVVSPLFFCMSGGLFADAGGYLHIGVPASDLHPVRQERDAVFVAGHFRVLAEPTRARLFISILSTPGSVSELAAGLRLPQSSVSDHLAVLRRAGLLEARRSGSRTVYTTSIRRVERLFDEARATLTNWE